LKLPVFAGWRARKNLSTHFPLVSGSNVVRPDTPTNSVAVSKDGAGSAGGISDVKDVSFPVAQQDSGRAPTMVSQESIYLWQRDQQFDYVASQFGNNRFIFGGLDQTMTTEYPLVSVGDPIGIFSQDKPIEESFT